MSAKSFSRRFATALFVALVTFTAASSHAAESGSDRMSRSDTPFFRPVRPIPVAYGYGYYHSSTAAEGFLRGKAAVIDAIGNFQVNEGQAEILREQARALDRENDLKQTEALQTQLKMFKDARIQSRKDRDTRLAEGQQLLAVRRATVYSQAYQLSADKLNLKTGEIAWPSAMQDARFEANRTRMEELFRQFAGYGERRVETANEIARVVDAWSRTLRSEVGTMPREDYVAAQKFLLGLKYGAAAVAQST